MGPTEFQIETGLTVVLLIGALLFPNFFLSGILLGIAAAILHIGEQKKWIVGVGVFILLMLIYLITNKAVAVGASLLVFVGIAIGRYKYEKEQKMRKAAQIVEQDRETEDSFTFQVIKGNKVVNRNPYRGMLVAGSAGSGKSATFIIPIINQAVAKGFSGLVYDYKYPNLAKHVAGAAKREEKENCYYVNFTDMNTSHRINPLFQLQDGLEARTFAKMLVDNLTSEKENFFNKSAVSFLSGTIHYFAKHKPEFCTVPHIIAYLTNAPYAEIIDVLCSDVEIRMSVKSIVEGSEAKDQSAGVKSSLLLPLGELVDKKAFWVYSGNDLGLDLNTPGQEKNTNNRL